MLQINRHLILLFTWIVSFGGYCQPGQLNWIKTFGSAEYDVTEKHVVDHEQSVIAIGTFHGTISIGGKSYTSKGESDMILFKSDQHGIVQWAHTLGAPHYHGDAGVDVDADGNIYITGGFINQLFVENTLKLTSTSPHWNSFLAKFSPDGELVWIKGIFGLEVRVFGCISVNDVGEIAVCGTFDQSIKIENTELTDPPGNPGNSIFYARLTTNGNLVWLKKQLSETFAFAHNIYLDNSGYLFSTGFFTTKIYFGAESLTAANTTHSDIFVAKFNPQGDPMWGKGGIKTTSAELNNEGRSITVDVQTGEVYVVGNFKGNVQFDSFTLNSTNTTEFSADIFIAKFSDTGEVLWAKREGTAGSDIGSSIKLTGSGLFLIAGGWEGAPFASWFTTDGIFQEQINFSAFGFVLTVDFLSPDNIFLSGSYFSPFQTTLGTEPHRGDSDAFLLNLKSCTSESDLPDKPLLSISCNAVVVSNYRDHYTVHWYVNGQLMPNENLPEISLQPNAFYKAVLSNVCGTAESDAVEHSLLKPEVYNIITPNLDSFNEYYELHESLLGAALFVFNRWGNLVYSSTQYNNTWNGENLASGVYYYMISHECLGKFVGTLSIIR